MGCEAGERSVRRLDAIAHLSRLFQEFKASLALLFAVAVLLAARTHWQHGNKICSPSSAKAAAAPA